jgi:hypothetical protein
VDIARGIEILVPDARYKKPIESETQEFYKNLIWLDDRAKPSWDQIFLAWSEAIESENISLKINELKKLLSDSDFRMTQDYYSTMSDEQKLYWTNKRQTWREEIYLLESKLK